MWIYKSFVLVLIGQAAAENVNYACCPPGYYTSSRQSKCWIPDTNETASLRLSCPYFSLKHFKIQENGSVELVFDTFPSQIVGADKICTGNETNRNKTVNRPVALACIDEEEPPIIADEILGGCMAVSAIFLTLTAVIYAALREIRDLLGKSIINLCGSLAIGLGILSIMKLMEYSDMNLCAVRGFLTYFCIMAAFFWSNAISIQIFRNIRKASVVDYGWKEFRWYALYAWGCPCLLTIVMAIVNFHPGKHTKPGIGLSHCWFLDTAQQWYYMNSVISILLCANIIIFVFTSLTVWRMALSSSHVRALRYRLTMMMRLFFVMGLLWVFEMISSLAEKHIVWGILDVMNSLQGPMMFLVLVVFRKRVIKAMLARGWFGCWTVPVEHLVAGSDCEENIIQHTELPMNEQ